jgi:hypothetical protein
VATYGGLSTLTAYALEVAYAFIGVATPSYPSITVRTTAPYMRIVIGGPRPRGSGTEGQDNATLPANSFGDFGGPGADCLYGLVHNNLCRRPKMVVFSRVMDLCPSCGMREADDYDTGWCSRCAGVAVTESYQSRKIAERRDKWLTWLARRRETA